MHLSAENLAYSLFKFYFLSYLAGKFKSRKTQVGVRFFRANFSKKKLVENFSCSKNFNRAHSTFSYKAHWPKILLNCCDMWIPASLLQLMKWEVRCNYYYYREQYLLDMFLARHRVCCDTLCNLLQFFCSIRLQQQFHLKAFTNIKYLHCMCLIGNMH